MQSKKEKEVTKLWEMYENGISYQTATGIRQNIPKFIDYYEGRQWGVVPKGTEAIPRVVVNEIKPICRNKKANILSVPFRLNFKSLKNPEKAQAFSRFAEYQQHAMGMSDIDSDAIDGGIKTGTYIYHYYWDKDAYATILGKNGGAVRCELLDPLNVFFANPCETDEQKQKWILIKSRVDVEALKAIADKGVDIDSIVEDNDEHDAYSTTEQEGSNLITVLTRYFRKNGEVYYERTTKNHVITKPTRFTPDLKQTSVPDDNDNIDAPDLKATDSPSKSKVKGYLYPIVVGQYEPKHKSIYGISEVEGIVTNQQAVNMIYSMLTKAVTDESWGKTVVTPTALQGQKITNNPGQILIDYDKSGNGIRQLKGNGVNSAPINVVKELISATRNSCGSNEVTNGEVLGANMSGSAIAQLQAQAGLPTEELRQIFWRTKKKCGLVLAQFFILFYDTEEFEYKEDNDPEGEVKTGVFNARDYDDMFFDIEVEATGGTRATSASDIQMLETIFKTGQMTILDFVTLYPEDAISNKTKIISVLKAAEQKEVIQLRQQNQQLTAQLQQSAELLEKQSKVIENVSTIVQKNNTLNAIIAQLFTEAESKVDIANAAIATHAETVKQAEEATKDATEFAQYIQDEINMKQSQQ